LAVLPADPPAAHAAGGGLRDVGALVVPHGPVPSRPGPVAGRGELVRLDLGRPARRACPRFRHVVGRDVRRATGNAHTSLARRRRATPGPAPTSRAHRACSDYPGMATGPQTRGTLRGLTPGRLSSFEWSAFCCLFTRCEPEDAATLGRRIVEEVIRH